MIENQSLSGIHILQGMSEDGFDALFRSCRWKRYRADEQIIDQLSDSRDIFFVVSGRVRVVNYSASGREITLDDVTAGGHFGELAAIDKQPRSASVMALEDSLVASLHPDRFMDMLRENPDVCIRVMRSMAAIIRGATGRIMDLSTLAANNRVQAELLRQARAIAGDEAQEVVISPIPIHSEIASRVSTTRETVARVFSDLTRRGLVERKKNALVLTNLKGLEGLVEAVRGEV